MPSWWGKSSSKEAKKSKTKRKENGIFDALNLRKLKESLNNTSSRGFGVGGGCNSSGSNNNNNNIEESASDNGSPSPSTSTSVTRCHSFVERSNGHPLPLPCTPPASALGRSESGITLSQQPPGSRSGQMSPFLPLPSPEQVLNRLENAEGSASGSVSSVSSMSSDDPADRDHSVASGSSSITHAGLSPKQSRKNLRQEILKPTVTFPNKQRLPISAKRGLLNRREAPKYLHIPVNGAVGSAPDSSMSSPSRSPLRVYVSEHSPNGVFCGTKINQDAALFGSGNCSSPGSGQNSGQNSMGGDMAALPFWQQSRGSSERSPILSPRMRSPGPSSRAQSCAVSPLHPRFGGLGPESPTGRLEEGKHVCHPLPLPPHSPCNSSPYTPSVSASAPSSAGPWSPGGKDNQTSPPGSRWKKGKLLGRGTFGHVYVGFNSESGEMCAMKEVTLFSDDPKSKESVKQLGQEIAMLSHLWHPNIVQYYGSETVDDMLYIYLEYVSGGSIHKLLQEYGQFRESVIRSYTQQILSGLAYLHNRSTVHRDIKGANILVDPNGQVKLADFGMAKHITAHSCPLSFKGSPYWMAPEVIKNVNGYDLAVDIWSLGCTVLEMATARPPWSQYEGVAAMFKIGNSKELPAIPEYFSEEGKSFVRLCLQRNPANRPTAAQLLEHPFVKNAAPFVKLDVSTENIEVLSSSANGTRPLNVTQSPLHTRNLSALEMDYSIPHSRGRSRCQPSSDHSYVQRNISLPVSPSASPLIQPRSPHHRYGGMSPSPISTPVVSSGSSTPLTGGYGAIPFQANGVLKHSAYVHEGFGNMTRLTNVMYTDGSGLNGVYLDPRPDVYGGMQAVRTPEGSPRLQHHTVAESDMLGKTYGKVVRNENGDSPMQYSGQGALAEHVSQQLLRTPSKLLGVDFRPVSPLLGRTSGAEYY